MSKELPPIIIHLPKLENTVVPIIEEPKDYYLPKGKSLSKVTAKAVGDSKKDQSDKRAVTIIEKVAIEKPSSKLLSKSERNVIRLSKDNSEKDINKGKNSPETKKNMLFEKERTLSTIASSSRVATEESRGENERNKSSSIPALPEITESGHKTLPKLKSPRSTAMSKMGGSSKNLLALVEKQEKQEPKLKDYNYDLLKKNIRLGVYFNEGSSGAYLNIFSKLNNVEASQLKLSMETYFTERENMYMQSKLIEKNIINQNNFIAISQPKEKIKIAIPKGKYFHVQVNIDTNNSTPLFISEKIVGSYDLFVSGKDIPTKEKYEIKSSSRITKLESSYNTRKFFISILSLMASEIFVSFEYEENKIAMNEKALIGKRFHREQGFNMTDSEFLHEKPLDSDMDKDDEEKMESKSLTRNIMRDNIGCIMDFSVEKKAQKIIEKKDELSRKILRAAFKREKQELIDKQKRYIDFLKRVTKNEELARKRYDDLTCMIIRFWEAHWLIFISFLAVTHSLRQKFLAAKTANLLRKIKEIKARKIQILYKKYRKQVHINSFEYIYRETLFSTRLLSRKIKKNTKKKAMLVIVDLFKAAKQPITIYIHFLKYFYRIKMIQDSWRSHLNSHNEKLTVLKNVWEQNLLHMIQKESDMILEIKKKKEKRRASFVTSTSRVKCLNNIDDKLKNEILKKYLEEKLMEYYKALKEYFNKIKNMDRKEEIMLKFTQNIQHENEEDPKNKYITSSSKTQDKIDYLSSSVTDQKPGTKNKKKNNKKEPEKTKKETKNEVSKKPGEKVNIVSNTDIKPPTEEANRIKSPEKIVKPVFKFIPDDELMVSMIEKIISEMMVHERRKKKKTTKKLQSSTDTIKLENEEGDQNLKNALTQDDEAINKNDGEKNEEDAKGD